MNKYHEALDDCKRAIAINEDYAKAFSRMALIGGWETNFLLEVSRAFAA